MQVMVPTPGLELETTVNAYIVWGNGEAILIDAGFDPQESLINIEAAWDTIGRPGIRGLILTHAHRDHARAAGHVANRFGCPIIVHPLDREAAVRLIRDASPTSLSVPIMNAHTDAHVSFGSDSLLILHAPGHTPGHIHLWWPAHGVLFVGDNVLGKGTTWIGPPEGDMTDYLSTLEDIRILAPTTIGPGHGPLVDHPIRAVDALIARRLARQDDIVAILQRGPRSSAAITQLLYGERVTAAAMWAAERTVDAYLIRLERLGQCRRRQDGRAIIWEWLDHRA